MDTQRLNFWKESIEKEALARILARQKRAEKGITAEQMIEQRRLNGEKRINRAKKMIPAVEIKQETLPPKDELNKDFKPERVELQDIMKPVSAKSKQRIYQGLSKEGAGRYDYLQSRKSKAPFEKFNYQACSSWDYGWDITSFQNKFKPSTYARTPIVNDTFYRRNGIHHRPIEL